MAATFSFTSCINDDFSGSYSNKILFAVAALFYEENLSETVHIPNDSTTVKSDDDFDANSHLNSEDIVTEGICSAEK